MGMANELRGTAWKVSKYGVFFWSVFSRIRTEYGEIVFSPNAGKYGPEKTPYLDTFHAVLSYLSVVFSVSFFCFLFLLF